MGFSILNFRKDSDYEGLYEPDLVRNGICFLWGSHPDDSKINLYTTVVSKDGEAYFLGLKLDKEDEKTRIVAKKLADKILEMKKFAEGVNKLDKKIILKKFPEINGKGLLENIDERNLNNFPKIKRNNPKQFREKKEKDIRMQLLKDTGYTLSVNEEVVKETDPTIQKGKLEFFNVGEYISDNDLEKEYERRGLEPVNLATLATWVKSHSSLEGRKNIATHWQDKDGNWSYVSFYAFYFDEESLDVLVGRHSYGWDGNWWFAGQFIKENKKK